MNTIKLVCIFDYLVNSVKNTITKIFETPSIVECLNKARQYEKSHPNYKATQIYLKYT